MSQADLPVVSPPRPRLRIPYIVLAVSLLITFAVAGYVAVTSAARDRARFENSVERTQVAIQRRLETYVNLLRGVAGLFAAQDSKVNLKEYQAYVERLELTQRYPGIQGIGVSGIAAQRDLPKLYEMMRREGFPDFAVRPSDPREIYHAIVYLEPLDARNRQAIGYDMFTEPTRRAAMEQARDTGTAATSGKVTLVQEIDENKQAGFLIYVPIYFTKSTPATVEKRRQTLGGFVYSPFRADDLLAGIVGTAPATAQTRFSVYDGDDANAAALLHRSAATADSSNPQFMKSTKLEVPGRRRWTVVYQSGPEFERSSRGYVLLVLAAGGVVSMLLFALSAAQAAARQRAEHAATESRRSAALLRASENKFRRLADANLVGVAFTRADGAVLEVNEEVCRILARPRSEVTAEQFKWHEVTPPEGLDADRRAIGELRSSGICAPYEKEFIRSDGSHVPVLLGIAQIEGAERDCVALVVDLTTRKQAERDLISAKETAERALEQAEQASRLKDEFLATVSHELRTPLNAILGWSQLLGHGRESAPTDLQHGLATIERAARAQAQLIDDLLDVSRIVAGKLRLDMQIVQPIHVIESALASIHPAADAKGVRIVNTLDAHAGPVSADPNRLQQIVWNLLANAVKFTPKDGVVQIALKRAEGDDATVQIVVSDTGIGIPHEFLPFVFDRFRQADASTTRRYGGLGLGLGIVRHLTELHGGTVTVDSAGPGSGSTFTVSLPRVMATPSSHAPDASAPKASANDASLPGVRVLLVEDDADARDLMSRVLHDSGAAVTAVGSAGEAMEIFPALRPDVLVSDIGMPDEDGYSLIARIRAMPADRGGRVPAVALTALARPEDRRRAILAGYQVHLAKPVEAAELSATIANLLDGKRPA